MFRGVLWGHEEPIDNTPGTRKVESSKLRSVDRGYANFVELRIGEVHSIGLLRGWVNAWALPNKGT